MKFYPINLDAEKNLASWSAAGNVTLHPKRKIFWQAGIQMKLYPINLDAEKKSCVVVGGGQRDVASKKKNFLAGGNSNETLSDKP